MKQVYQFANEFAASHGFDCKVFRKGLSDFKIPHATFEMPNEETAIEFINAIKVKFNMSDGFIFLDKWEYKDEYHYDVHIFKRFFTYKVNKFLDEFKALAEKKGYDSCAVLDNSAGNCPFVMIKSVTIPTIADVRELCENYRIPSSHIETQYSWGYMAVYLNYPEF